MLSNDDKFAGAACECGHSYEEHRKIAECTVHGCKCDQFHPVVRGGSKPTHSHTCEVCGRTYNCGHERCDTVNGVCNICSKTITNNYKGDLIMYLFGVVDDRVINQIKAKKLALDIHSNNMTVKALYDFWIDHQYKESLK